MIHQTRLGAKIHPIVTIVLHNRDLDEPIFFAQHGVIGLLRLLLPPHMDNKRVAEYLRS